MLLLPVASALPLLLPPLPVASALPLLLPPLPVASALPLTINAIKGPPLTIIPGGFQTTNGSFKLC